MRIAIIGAGRVGGTLGHRWAIGGHHVVFGVRNPADAKVQVLLKAAGANAGAASIHDAAAGAEIVVLATPWGAARDAIASAGALSGKILIDCTNPLGKELLPVTDSGTSAAEEIAALASGARVVKAFNTTGYNIMQNPELGEKRAAMFLCGDDEGARIAAASLAGELGFETIDCGPLQNARLLESMAALWVWLAINNQGLGRDFAFGVLRN